MAVGKVHRDVAHHHRVPRTFAPSEGRDPLIRLDFAKTRSRGPGAEGTWAERLKMTAISVTRLPRRLPAHAGRRRTAQRRVSTRLIAAKVSIVESAGMPSRGNRAPGRRLASRSRTGRAYRWPGQARRTAEGGPFSFSARISSGGEVDGFLHGGQRHELGRWFG